MTNAAVARARARAARSSSGTRMCANAPSSMRTSASSASAAGATDCGCSRVDRRERRRARPRTPRASGHRALAFGLHLVERERAVAACTSAPSARRSTPAGGTVVGRRRVRATPSPAGRRATSTRPAAGCRRGTTRSSSAAGRAGSSAELVDVELVGVRRLADLRLGRRVATIAGSCSTSSSVPTSTRRSRSSPAVSSAPIGTRAHA